LVAVLDLNYGVCWISYWGWCSNFGHWGGCGLCSGFGSGLSSGLESGLGSGLGCGSLLISFDLRDVSGSFFVDGSDLFIEVVGFGGLWLDLFDL